MRLIIFLSLLILLKLSLCECQVADEQTTANVNEEQEYPSQEGWNSKIFISNAGRLQAKVHYGHMRKFDSRQIYLFDEGVEVDFYDSDGNHTSHLTSERGEYFENNEDVIGKGNVVVVSDSGITLYTEALRWDNRREKIISDTLIMLTTPDYDTLYGLGFESNADLTHRVIRKPWGISDRRLELEKIDETFSKGTPADSVKRDSTGVEKQ